MINVRDHICDYCAACITICPVDCIEVREYSIQIDNILCIDCDLCIDICPIEVLESIVEE